MSYIEINKLYKIYNEGKENAVHALNGIDLKIEKGEMLAVIGPSGSGKSTLIHIIGCIDKATKGDYFFEGQAISGLSNSELALVRSKKIGFALQEFGLLPHKKVWENVAVPMYFNKTKLRDIKPMAMEQLKMLDIGKLAHKKTAQLSGGEKQRVAIARALINSPDVILADEPTGSLDSVTAKRILDIFTALNEQGKTMIIVTHNMNVAKICNRIVQIHDGAIIKEESYK